MARNVAEAQELPSSNLAAQISECKTNYDILRLAREFAKTHGYDHFSITRLPEPGERKLAAIVIVSNWPADLTASYDEFDLLEKSPAEKALRRSTRPIVWRQDKLDRQSPDYPGDAYYDLFARFGIKSGVVIPVHQASGQRGALMLSGNRADPSETELMELSYYANLFFARIAELGNNERDVDHVLSTRERECVRWTASGKTSQEIAAILKLSEHTVNHYLSAACQKLGATNRAHAVAKALRSGLLD